ncbi:Crp/Fnr family transcriptional regulator [Sediminibacterium goheungense]|uniref:CRP-like cAMP-binding protein n=1 Tax=Sediminibacterium goheungense TaxID=1086393 RepID=A0A4R6J023_9BACT|nr:Crp/Fnr family transcriptional regulator [Sediminibacterium goheungense]TDO28510.1 CRP-like cAMP-binding protein [Sediminibacterium goheungense]
MEALYKAIQSMINISTMEWSQLEDGCIGKTFRKNQLLSRPFAIPNEIFFIEKGLVRVVVTDEAAVDHSIHFAMENQFICDYASFIQHKPSVYSIQALEDTDVIILPRALVAWGYEHFEEGNKLGRLIAEFYFIYQDNRIKNMIALSPKERYDAISEVFPDIHNRVPQHMIASYLGITPVHLSRLKKTGQRKI